MVQLFCKVVLQVVDRAQGKYEAVNKESNMRYRSVCFAKEGLVEERCELAKLIKEHLSQAREQTTACGQA